MGSGGAGPAAPATTRSRGGRPGSWGDLLAREKWPYERISVSEIWKHNGRAGRAKLAPVVIARDADETKAPIACRGQVPQGIADVGDNVKFSSGASRRALQRNA